MIPEASGAATLPPVQVTAGDRSWVARPGGSFVIGRDPAADVELSDERVSRWHAVLLPTPQGWQLNDWSRNGTYVDGTRVSQHLLTGPLRVMMGAPVGGLVIDFAPVAAGGPTPDSGPARSPRGRMTGMHSTARAAITIGRMPDNDVVVDDLLVSRWHARMERTARGWRIVDLDSDNGTHLNGRRVQRADISPGDLLGVGHTQLQLVGDRLEVYVESGDVQLVADGLTVERAGRTILRDVGFELDERNLLAVVGPSGSGKSTLLGALTGLRPADGGSVQIGGRDLYEEYDELRQRIGFVPQDDILHPQLTAARALSFAAELRLPRDITPAERARRVAVVLQELGLAPHADTPIRDLSGGQRKRTSVALELLTGPSAIFLDEPTSGLDPGMDRAVMQTLRRLADEGRTVVVVTHSLANIGLADQLLVLARGGRVAFYGPPAEALAHFRSTDFADVFDLLDAAADVDWEARFAASGYPGARRMAARRGHERPPAVRAQRRPRPVRVAPRSGLRQLAVLVRRYVSVIAADRAFLALLSAMPVVLALLTLVVPGRAGLSVAAAAAVPADRGQPGQVLLLMIVAGVLMGTFGSVRELVKEREIYRRERAGGLSAAVYLGSKVVVLGVVACVQAIVLTVLVVLWHGPPDGAVLLTSPPAEIAAAVVLATVGSTAIGLLISAAIANPDRSMPPLALAVMAQIVLSGALFDVDRPVLAQLSWISPSRWTYAMGAGTLDLNLLRDPAATDALWEAQSAVWLADALVVLGLAVVVTAVPTLMLLRRLDPRRRGPAVSRPRPPWLDSRP